MTTAVLEKETALDDRVRARNAMGDLRDKLVHAFIEREAEIDAILLAIIAKEHCWLTGPWGTGKSLLIRSACEAIDRSVFFEYLMMKDTDRSELLGYVDMEAVQVEKKWRRLMKDHLPEAHFVFLDEFPRASSFAANICLRGMNERELIDMGKRIPLPLHSLVAGGNDWPVGDGFQEWGAIFDRFLIRRQVKPVSETGRARLAFGDLPPVGLCCDLDDVNLATAEAAKIPVSDEAKTAFMSILEALAKEGINPGDRRIRKSVQVCRAAAYLDDSPIVQVHHLEPLVDVLWEDPINHPKKADAVIRQIANPIGATITALMIEVDDAMKASNTGGMPAVAEALKKLENSMTQAMKIKGDGPTVKKAAQLVDYIKGEQIKLAVKLTGGIVRPT